MKAEKTQVDKKLLGAILGMIAAIIFVALMCGWCTGGTSRKPASNVSYSYRVDRSTGLYESTDVESDQIAILSVGDRLIIPDNKLAPECVTNHEFNITSCYFYSPKHKAYGWVIKKWLVLERD